MSRTHHLFSPPRRKQGTLAWDIQGFDMGAWYAIHDKDEVPPGEVALVDRPWSGARGIRAAKTPPRVLPTYEGGQGLVVDADLAASIGDLPGVARRPVTLRDAKGPLPTPYVLLEVHARAPLDRRHVTGTFVGGWLDKLRSAEWGPDRVPAAPMFRLLERPRLLFVEPALAAALVDASRGAATLDDYDADYPHVHFPPSWSLEGLPRLGAADDAEAAFWAHLAGDAAARPHALADPFWAYAVARCVDGRAAEDTRQAVCHHPIVAALYASEVERQDIPSLAAASTAHGLSALRYATHVRGAIDPEAFAAERIAEAGHDAGTFAEHVATLAQLVGHRAPAPAAPRSWPAHGLPRYAADGPGVRAVTVEVQSDIDAFIARGLSRLGLPSDAAPDTVARTLQDYLAAIASGTAKLGPRQGTTVRMELGCAWGDALHRAFGWQWAEVALPEGGGIALVSPDRALAHYPFDTVAPWLRRRRGSPTLMLLFNMIDAERLPAGPPGALSTLR